ncbi:hypothetical protein NIES4074_47430 [Cylindrospermum sp. NIES-4074]|nr:hypothetical protein NIES4074_47430 [Cylindrospermum sp. NIES-4074]
MSKLWVWVKGISIIGAIAFSGNSAIAQINQEAILPNNSDVTPQENIRIVEGETQDISNPSRSCKQVPFSSFSKFDFQNAANFQKNISGITNQTYSTLGDDILKLEYSSYQTHNQVYIGVNKQQYQNLAGTITKTDGKLTQFTISGCAWCVPCPTTGNPIGCYSCNCP